MKHIMLAILALLMPGVASAEVIMNFDQSGIFSGPTSAHPGTFRAVFKSIDTNKVRLTLTSNLAADAFLLPAGAAYFSVDPVIDPTSLKFVLESGPAGLVWQEKEDGFKPDGDGLMDLMLTGPAGSKLLKAGEMASWMISATGLVETSFLSYSVCNVGCGSGSHLAALHAGGLPETGGGTTSVWIAPTSVPVVISEAASVMLLSVGFVGLMVARRRR